MWQSGTQFSVELRSVGFIVGLSDLKSLYQHKLFYIQDNLQPGWEINVIYALLKCHIANISHNSDMGGYIQTGASLH